VLCVVFARVNDPSLTVDDSSWPIVKARWNGAMSDEQLVDVLEKLDAYLARGERFGLLIDARGGRGLSSHQRRMLVMHMKAAAPLTAKYLVQAIVHDNAVMRTLDNTIGWMLPRPFVSKTFADPAVALAWLNEKLAVSAPSR
jgi:hypothetical protein